MSLEIRVEVIVGSGKASQTLEVHEENVTHAPGPNTERIVRQALHEMSDGLAGQVAALWGSSGVQLGS